MSWLKQQYQAHPTAVIGAAAALLASLITGLFALVSGDTINVNPTPLSEETNLEHGSQPDGPTTSSTLAPQTTSSRQDADETITIRSLGDLPQVEKVCGAGLRFGEAEVSGDSYPRSLVWHLPKDSEVCSMTYNLSRDWDTLRGAIGIRDDSLPGAMARFEVFVDGIPADLGSESILEIGDVTTFEIDVTEALRVELLTTNMAVGTLQSWVWGTPEVVRQGAN